MQSALLRAARGTLLPSSTRPRISLNATPDQTDRLHPYSWWAAKRGAASLPTGGGNSARVRATTVGARRDALVASFLWSPLPLDPLPLRVPIPVELNVPMQHAPSADGHVFAVEASLDCTCELFQPVSAADVRDAIISAAHAAVSAETMQGGWKFHSRSHGWEKDAYEERIMARMASSLTSPSMKIDLRSFNVTNIRLEPLATLATAATRLQEPAMAPVAAACVELVCEMNKDAGRPMNMEEMVQAATATGLTFFRLCSTPQPALPLPQNRRWILILLGAVLVVAFLLPVYVVSYAILFPEKWCERKDAVIEAYAQSFKHASSWGIFGESLVQRRNRIIAEQQRQRQEEERKRMMEEEKLRREEECRKQLEEFEARRRFEATLTPWQLIRHRLTIGDYRYQLYRRP